MNNLIVIINNSYNSFVQFKPVNSNNLGQDLRTWWDNYIDCSISLRVTGNIFKRNNVTSLRIHDNLTKYSLVLLPRPSSGCLLEYLISNILHSELTETLQPKMELTFQLTQTLQIK